MRTGLMMLALLSMPVAALCDEPAAGAPTPPQGVWTGKGQVGFVASQGNTDAKAGNAAIDMGLLEGVWTHTLHLGGLYSESANVVSAERWNALWQSNYAFNPVLFGFGALRYEHDLFSGFEHQASATAGLGYKILDTRDVKLSAQLGAGYRDSRPEDLIKDAAGNVVGRIPLRSSGEAIATAGLDYSQALTASTTLSDKLLVESGSSDTLITNALALAVKVSDRLALSLGYELQDNTKPPAGLKKIDTTETVHLVFSF